MSFTAGLYCSESDRLYSISSDRYVCEITGGPLVVVYDYEQLGEALETEGFETGDDEGTLDRFAPLLPFQKAHALDHLQFSGTPVKTLFTGTDRNTFFKDESELSGGTTWTRGSAVVRGLLDEWEVSLTVGTNAGPSGRSLATQLSPDRKYVLVTSADHGDCPKGFPPSAKLYAVDLGPDELNERVLSLVESENWMFGTPGWNPYFQEGLKTVALELHEQLDALPDAVYVAGFSNHPAGAVKKGFVELKKIGWIEDLPRVVSVTPTDADAFVDRLGVDEGATSRTDFNEGRMFTRESLGGIDTIDVVPERVTRFRDELPDDHELRRRPTGLLGYAALGDGPSPDRSAVVVGTGLGTPDTGHETPEMEHVDGSIESLRTILRNLE